MTRRAGKNDPALYQNLWISTYLRYLTSEIDSKQLVTEGSIQVLESASPSQLYDLLVDRNETPEAARLANQADILLIPYVQGAHHRLVVVDLKSQTYLHQDSLGGQIDPTVKATLAAYFTGFTLQDAQLRQQNNGEDCGPWVCKNAEDVIRGHLAQSVTAISTASLNTDLGQTREKVSQTMAALGLYDSGDDTSADSNADPAAVKATEAFKQAEWDSLKASIASTEVLITQGGAIDNQQQASLTHLELQATRTINNMLDWNQDTATVSAAINATIAAFEKARTSQPSLFQPPAVPRTLQAARERAAANLTQPAAMPMST